MPQRPRTPTNLPSAWTVDGRQTTSGQAVTIPVRHHDGRAGVYRELRTPLTDVAIQRFRRELRLLSQLVKHRSIVTLFDWAVSPDAHWYISERGDSFAGWWRGQKSELRSNPRGLVECALSVLHDLSSALSLCHTKGIVHRDIKPKNIIVKVTGSDTWPILIDFGVAHVDRDQRLTPADDAVGNARFSPDVMRRQTPEVVPWLDVFSLGQLLIWMLDEDAPKDHWQRPVDWRHVQYTSEMPNDVLLSLQAVTAACSNRHVSPANGTEFVELLERLFPRRPHSATGRVDTGKLVAAKTRGEATAVLTEAALAEEIRSSAPLAERTYADLRNVVLGVLSDMSTEGLPTRVILDKQFAYQTIGATDLLWVAVGPQRCSIQLRIKTKIVPWSDPLPRERWNRDYWQRHMSKDAICFTFALEGGVIEAGTGQYLMGRWVTVQRNGAIRLHPLEAAFGNFSNNDLGGSAEGRGETASMDDVRSFVLSLWGNATFWEYVGAYGSN